MLSSISPVGEAARRQRWPVTVAAYVVASTLSGVALGGALGWVGTRSGLDGDHPALLIIGVLGVLGLLADLAGGVPSLHRQVDRAWLDRYRGWVYGAGFGAQLGVGIVTIVPGSIVWLVWLVTLLSGSAGWGATIGGAFGLVRAVPLAMAGRATTVDRLRRLLVTVDRARPAAARVTLAGQAIVACMAIVVGTRAGLG